MPPAEAGLVPPSAGATIPPIVPITTAPGAPVEATRSEPGTVARALPMPAPAPPAAEVETTRAIAAREPPIPLPLSRPTVAVGRPEPAGQPSHRAGANGEVRIYQLRATAGSSCLSVFLGETRAVREELPFSTAGRFAVTRHDGTLCGFEFALGRGLGMAIDPTFLAATRERTGTEPNTRRFLLTESRHGRALPRRSTIEVDGGGRATRTYELTIGE